MPVLSRYRHRHKTLRPSSVIPLQRMFLGRDFLRNRATLIPLAAPLLGLQMEFFHSFAVASAQHLNDARLIQRLCQQIGVFF